MARVIYIKEGKTKGYITVGALLDGQRRSYTVPSAIYSALGSPARAEELDGDALLELERADAEYRAIKKALGLLSYSDNSERSLFMKLRRSGFPRDISEGAVREAVRLGYINEERQLERLILNETNGRLHGPMKLMARLSAKGYSRGKIKSAVDALVRSGELDFEKNKQRLMEKHAGDALDGDEKNKLLYKYGYRIC